MHPGDSTEQRQAEDQLLKKLSHRLNVHLAKKSFDLGPMTRSAVDGYCDSPRIYCEVWAHIGKPKSAQKNKVMTDGFKLHYLREINGGDGRCILLLADEVAAQHFQDDSWMAKCLKYFGIEVMVEKLDPEMEKKIIEAQKRQKR